MGEGEWDDKEERGGWRGMSEGDEKLSNVFFDRLKELSHYAEHPMYI